MAASSAGRRTASTAIPGGLLGHLEEVPGVVVIPRTGNERGELVVVSDFARARFWIGRHAVEE